jgi:hypothetical protein
LIEESDGDETKNQVGASPEPDVLMKHVEYDDSNHKQDVFHGGEKVSSPFGECQEPQKKDLPQKGTKATKWIRSKNQYVLLCLIVAQLRLKALARIAFR